MFKCPLSHTLIVSPNINLPPLLCQDALCQLDTQAPRIKLYFPASTQVYIVSHHCPIPKIVLCTVNTLKESLNRKEHNYLVWIVYLQTVSLCKKNHILKLWCFRFLCDIQSNQILNWQVEFQKHFKDWEILFLFLFKVLGTWCLFEFKILWFFFLHCLQTHRLGSHVTWGELFTLVDYCVLYTSLQLNESQTSETHRTLHKLILHLQPIPTSTLSIGE